MLSPPAPPPGVPGYNDYRAPTEADARAALRRVFGPERGEERWADACRAAGLPVGHAHGADKLARAVQALSAQGGPSTAIARSIEIRMRTHTRLSAKAAAEGGRG